LKTKNQDSNARTKNAGGTKYQEDESNETDNEIEPIDSQDEMNNPDGD